MVLKRLEIALPEAEVMGAIHLGGTTHEVMGARLEWVAFAVVPDVLGEITALLEHRIRIPVLGFLRQPVAALEDQNSQPGWSQHTGQSSAARTTPDNQHIEMADLRLLQLAKRLEQVHGNTVSTCKLETISVLVAQLS